MLFNTLKTACREEWQQYLTHPFVRTLGAGTLDCACFAHYLKQDYLFLIQFARAYGLAAYKSRTLADIRQAAAGLTAMIDTEIGLHVAYCAEWGIPEDALLREPESRATLAYTRYVLERGMAGDLLELHVALAPCIVGYGELAAWLVSQPETRLAGNPYRSWIEMYAGTDYARVAAEEVAYIDVLGEGLPPSRIDALAATFRDATRLEIDFWDMGLNLST